MPSIDRAAQTRPYAAPAYYQARPGDWRTTALYRHTRQLLSALTRRAQRLRLPRPADYKLEPMPRMRWYS